MPIFSKGTSQCLFIHIPKTGGTSIEYGMRRLGWRWSLIHLGSLQNTLRQFKISPQHYHGALLDQIVRLDAMDLVFTLCRHPFDRLKSEYYWQHSTGLAKDAEPEAWISRALVKLKDDESSFDNHLRPQAEFLLPSHDCKILRLEDDGVRHALKMADSLAPAGSLRRWSVSVLPVWKNRSTSSRRVEQAFASLRPQIESFYAADMGRFGY